MNIAVVVITYKRPLHTGRVLQNLGKCIDVADFKITLVSDGIGDLATDSDLESHKQTRILLTEYSRTYGWNSVFRNENLGLSNNIELSITDALQDSDAVIVLEDDILVAEHFLVYMEKALAYYSNHPTVHGVSGHSFYHLEDANERFPETYLLPIGTSWGWATWQDKWSRRKNEAAWLLKTIEDQGLINSFDFGGYAYSKMLAKEAAGKIDSWAIRFYASFFLEQGYFVFPKLSLCENIGFDNTATHSKKQNLFSPSLAKFDFMPNHFASQPDKEIIDRMKSHFHAVIGRENSTAVSSRKGWISSLKDRIAW